LQLLAEGSPLPYCYYSQRSRVKVKIHLRCVHQTGRASVDRYADAELLSNGDSGLLCCKRYIYS
jgi:hypothetical protein